MYGKLVKLPSKSYGVGAGAAVGTGGGATVVAGAEVVGGATVVLGKGFGATVLAGSFGVLVEVELPDPALTAVLLVTAPGRLLVVVERMPVSRWFKIRFPKSASGN